MKIKDISIWESFYRVAMDSSFIVAANKLRIGAPLLTKRIQTLEAELGVRLFQRTTRKVSLTQDGLALVKKVKSILEDLNSLETEFEKSDKLSGLIRISSVTAFAHRILSPILIKFSKLHPEIRFELDASDRFVDLIESQTDIGIRVQEPEGADFVYKKIVSNDLIFCASKKYLGSTKFQIRAPNDLKKHSLLMLKVYQNCKFTQSQVPLSTYQSSVTIDSESGLLLTELALGGAGIAVRSYWDVKPLIEEKKLIQVLKEYPLEPFGTLYSVVSSKRLMAKRVRAFLDYLEIELKKIKLGF